MKHLSGGEARLAVQVQLGSFPTIHLLFKAVSPLASCDSIRKMALVIGALGCGGLRNNIIILQVKQQGVPPRRSGGSVQKEAGGWGKVAVKLTKCRTGLPRRLMRCNPEKSLSSKPGVIFSKIIGQMCPEEICKHSRDNGIVSDKEHWGGSCRTNHPGQLDSFS